MSNLESYSKEIESINTETKRLNDRLKVLRSQKRTIEAYLYDDMTRNNLEKYGKITLKSITPREKKSRKSTKAKRNDAISLFRDVGINNPEQFWNDFQATQKYTEIQS
uniref:Uncharacterized protein n=1 Tax=Marseillevirus LCMAC102 TaxID=2506603 RepID=A0A481YTX8_9VIRU|nr:MAG: uncharacterized protein LCMAC102_01360 [Marseillevirus LCMAC102]